METHLDGVAQETPQQSVVANALAPLYIPPLSAVAEFAEQTLRERKAFKRKRLLGRANAIVWLRENGHRVTSAQLRTLGDLLFEPDGRLLPKDNVEDVVMLMKRFIALGEWDGVGPPPTSQMPFMSLDREEAIERR